MSDYRAIASVTASLREILQETANKTLGGATVTIKRPDARDEANKDQPGINLFLYRSSVNPAHRNRDLPTRSSNGQLIQRPQIGLNLDYLVTFYGAGFQPQLLLGQTVCALNTEPILTASRVRAAIENVGTVAAGAELAQSDLADTIERISFSPIPLDLEEISKLWSAFLHVPYELSVAYQVSAVLLDADVSTTEALPVQVINISAVVPSFAEAPVPAPDTKLVLSSVSSKKSGAAHQLTMRVDPPMTEGQRGTVLLNPVDVRQDKRASELAVDFRVAKRQSTLSITVPGLEPGTRYLVRVRTDGKTSELDYDSELQRYLGPSIGPAGTSARRAKANRKGTGQ